MNLFTCFKKAFNITMSENGVGRNVVWGIHQNKHMVCFEIAVPLRCDQDYIINSIFFFEYIINDHGYHCDINYDDDLIEDDDGTRYILLKGSSNHIQYESIGTSRMFSTSRVSNYTLEQHKQHMKRLVDEIDVFSEYAVFFELNEEKAARTSLFCTKHMKRGSWAMRGEILAFRSKKDGMYFKLKMP